MSHTNYFVTDLGGKEEATERSCAAPAATGLILELLKLEIWH
jgi:hypothetical protein